MPFMLLEYATVYELHEESIQAYGGVSGIRDYNLLMSAMQRPDYRMFYDPDVTLAELAACFAFGLSQNHPFNDGNKRTSFAATMTFLVVNGYVLDADPAEETEVWRQLGAGEILEPELAEWIEQHLLTDPERPAFSNTEQEFET